MNHRAVESTFAFVVTAALLAIAPAASFAGDVIYVDANAAASGDGLSWPTAYKDLQNGLADATGGDEIWVARGDYRPTPSADRTATFQLSSGVAVYGGFPTGGGDGTFAARNSDLYESILTGDLGENDTGPPTDPSRADNSYHVVTTSGVDATARLDGFTISGGNGDGTGNNNRGAAILNLGGSPRIVDCTLSRCIATFGGAMFSTGASFPTMIGCTIADNIGRGQAGGIYSASGSNVSVVNGRILRNSSLGVAGGMFAQFDATLTNCIFHGNVAATDGGGLYTLVGRAVVTNCTFAGNTAASGAGMYAAFGGSTQTSIVRNCIAWGNTPDQIVPGGNPISVDHSNVQGGWTIGGSGNINTDPSFVNASIGDLHLQVGSPSIDTGLDTLVAQDVLDLDGDLDTTEPVPFDLDGVGRFFDGNAIAGATVDMGAYEFSLLDSDGDGLLDIDEFALGTDPYDPDTDDDGLLDGPEVALAGGTGCPDPLVADSDADGDGDGIEVAGGFDPCDASPVANLSVEQLTDIGTDALVRLDGSGSTDAESPPSALSFTWTIDGDVICSGDQATCGTIEVELSFGSHDINLRVVDPAGGTDETDSLVTLDAAALSVFEFDRVTVDFKPTPGTMTMKGEIGLPSGVDFSEVSPLTLVGFVVAGVDVLPIPVAPITFEVTGGDQNKWKYRDDQGTLGITRFDIDWRGCRFEYKEHGVPFSLKSHIITSSETVLSFKYRMKDIDGPFSLDIGGLATIAVDGNGDATADVPLEVIDAGRKVTVTLPFPITDATILTTSGAVIETIAADEYMKVSIGRLRIEAVFDGALFPDGADTTPRTLETSLFVGVSAYPALLSLGPDDLEVKSQRWRR